MQISQLVSVRRSRWRILDVRGYEHCQLVTLAGIAAPQIGVERQILTPFDDVEAIDRPRRPRMVRAAAWRRACRTLVASVTPPGSLRSVRHARVDVMAHQLEPALAVVRGLGSRVLLADEVGLGKTIQAGIVICELQARGAADRVLVLTPAGLREQWANELSTRFALDAQIADAATLRRRTATLPPGMNPWSTARIAVASLDYVKRPEVLPAVAACPWDIVVVDEAHGAVGDTDRRAAVSALTSRAAYVLLLTATPHSGDHQTFVSLCALGNVGAVDNDPLLVFRRTRADVRTGAARRIHALRVQPNAEETRMHALLDCYTTAIRYEHPHAWLAASVLHKRALSSAWALAESLDRRLDILSRADSDPMTEQLALPLSDADGELNVADEPPPWPAGVGLADRARESRMLGALLTAARSAARRETKLHALLRLLRRSKERAVVFTEYRDTLRHVQAALGQSAALLHGGLAREERAAALADFSSGRRTILLATDAAGEGLNLHDSCRLVVNLELPWNPMRLEQRIGRVDRIGQRHTVHAIHLIAGRTGEMRILARLQARIARARAEIGAPDPVGADEERAAAQLVLDGTVDDATTPARRNPPVGAETFPWARGAPPPRGPQAPVRPYMITPDLRIAAVAEVQRLTVARALVRREDEGAGMRLEAEGPWIARAHRRTRAALGHRVMLLWRVECEDACGRSVESTLVPIAVEPRRLPGVRNRAWVETLLRQVDTDVRALIDRSSGDWRTAADCIARAFIARRIARERELLANLAPANAHAFQPGLFDRRAERSRLIAAGAQAAADADRAGRLLALERDAAVVSASVHLLLVLLP